MDAIDLFAGAGGATTGLKAAGFEVIAAIENDTASIGTYSLNHPEVRIVSSDIRAIDPGELLKTLKSTPGDIDLLTACPPCQGFSTLGDSDRNDPRNDLIQEVWRFARVLKPKALLLENVPGLRRDIRLENLVKSLRSIGYGASVSIEDAANFGVPQIRKRLVLLAVLRVPKKYLPDHLYLALPEDFEAFASVAGEVFQMLESIESVGDPLQIARQSTETVKQRLARIPVGGDRFDLPDHLQLPCHRRLKGRRATASYGRIRAEEPAPTLTTRCTTPACGRFVHPTKSRGLSLREAATLQSFPVTYQFCGTYEERERQIGNAVPVKMVEGIGRIIMQYLVPESSVSREEVA